jgi:toxin ParE1/3/4
MTIDWTEFALDRVDEIAAYIARDDLDAAVRWTVELFDSVDQLAEFPESGRMVPELETQEVRELIYGPYRVFYHVGPTVEVLTVQHGSMLLRPDELTGD